MYEKRIVPQVGYLQEYNTRFASCFEITDHSLLVRVSDGRLLALRIECGAAVIFQIMVVCQNQS
jgi:hypothetical protein